MKTQSTHAATSETTTQPSETDVITADRAAAQGVQGHLSLEAQVTLCYDFGGVELNPLQSSKLFVRYC